ncbi:hypothetical protein ACFLS7_04410 [Bacteroidota bacterium]
MKKIVLLIGITLAFTAAATSQDLKPTGGMMPHSYYTITWNSTFTLGDFNKWVGSGSPAGMGFGGRYFIDKGFNAGFDISWQRVSQAYGYETYYGDDGSAITATNYRFTWMVPFQITAGYMFKPASTISPYVSLGIGGDYMEHHLVVQEYDFYEKRWDFALNPEIGALVKFGYYKSIAALVAVNYKWTSNTINILDEKSGYLSMIGLRVGICFMVY